MFGELVAVWLYQAWLAGGRPLPVTIAEIGPGRGTLMKDMLRTLSRLDPDLANGAASPMIETSPRLAEVQKQTLAATPFRGSLARKSSTRCRNSRFSSSAMNCSTPCPFRQFRPRRRRLARAYGRPGR